MEENNKPYTLSQYRQDQEKQNPYTLSQYRADQQDEPKFVDDGPITLSQYKEENIGPMGNLFRTTVGAGRDLGQGILDLASYTEESVVPTALRSGWIKVNDAGKVSEDGNYLNICSNQDGKYNVLAIATRCDELITKGINGKTFQLEEDMKDRDIEEFGVK